MQNRRQKYTLNIRHEHKVVEVIFGSSSMSFKHIKPILSQLKSYIIEGYQIKFKGYLTRESSELRAFMFALSLFGFENRIVFENKSRYSKADRRRKRKLAYELRNKGYSVREISEELNVPLKTVYRWLKGK